MKKYNSAVKIITNIFTFVYIVVVFLLVVFLIAGKVDWLIAASTIFSSTIELVLLYALNNALSRIALLENDKNENNDTTMPIDDEIKAKGSEQTEIKE